MATDAKNCMATTAGEYSFEVSSNSVGVASGAAYSEDQCRNYAVR